MIKPWLFLRLLLAHLLMVGVLLTPQRGATHPMGNFSINHFSALEIHPSHVRVVYILDLAEIPTFQEMQEHTIPAQPDDPRVASYRERKIRELQRGLVLQVGEQVLPLAVRSSSLTFPPGAGGLPTLRLEAVYEAPLEVSTGQLTYEDRNYTERVGWKEIIATGHDGVTLSAATVPRESKSNRLTVYTDDLLQAPPQDLRAALSFIVSAPAQEHSSTSAVASRSVAAATRPGQPQRSLLTELITARQLSISVIVFALCVAFGLGAFHALEPGHGKTLVAAYLVGSQGTAWHAVILGLTVTVSHTIGVYALGVVALFAAHYVLPEQLYPWLGLTSGLLIAGMGVVLLTQAWNRYREAHAHDRRHSAFHAHTHGHEHDHQHLHDHDHPHAPQHAHLSHGDHHTVAPVGYGTLLTLGITGGMIPCPAALVVLLSAVALQRIAFGLLLIVAFSFGLAVVLVGTGMLLVSARELFNRWSGNSPWQTYLPFLSPLVITPLGLLIAFRSLFEFSSFPSLPF